VERVSEGFTLASLARLVSVLPCMISGFRREVDEKCILLDHYAASTDNYLRTLRDNLSVQEWVVPKRR
jgi:hypothetical protein